MGLKTRGELFPNHNLVSAYRAVCCNEAVALEAFARWLHRVCVATAAAGDGETPATTKVAAAAAVFLITLSSTHQFSCSRHFTARRRRRRRDIISWTRRLRGCQFTATTLQATSNRPRRSTAVTDSRTPTDRKHITGR